MSDNHTRCLDHDCPSKDTCIWYMSELLQGAGYTYYFHSPRFVVQDKCDEYESTKEQ